MGVTFCQVICVSLSAFPYHVYYYTRMRWKVNPLDKNRFLYNQGLMQIYFPLKSTTYESSVFDPKVGNGQGGGVFSLVSFSICFSFSVIRSFRPIISFFKVSTLFIDSTSCRTSCRNVSVTDYHEIIIPIKCLLYHICR